MPLDHALATSLHKGLLPTLSGSASDAFLGDGTYGKISLTTGVSGVLPEPNGGTNQSTYVLGDTLYASAANVLSKLAGNTVATRKFLRQTGTGAASQAPTWDTVLAADVPGSALTTSSDTNITLTLGGSSSTALLNAASITAGWASTLALSRGGTAANLTASNGGIVYSTASAFAVLSGTATAGQILRSGASTTPAWSTPTFPNTATSNKALVGDGTNIVLSTPTIPLTSSPSAGKLMIGDGANWVASTPTWPTSAGTAKNVPRSDGTNFVAAQLQNSDLSDFATGTFTPTIAFGGGTTGITYSQQVGTYTQIGKRVLYTIAITLTSKGSSTGAFTIATTLPTADSTFSATVGVMSNAATLTGPPVFQIRGSGTTIDGYIDTATGTTSLADTNFTNTTSFNFSGQYTVP